MPSNTVLNRFTASSFDNSMQTPSDFTPFPWMKIALGEFGQRENPAQNENNPRISKYFATVGLSGARDDETAWCSAFVNWCMTTAGFMGTGKGAARSWLTWGNSCLSGPVYGAITVLWRTNPSSWEGHVAFCVGESGSNLILFGGNQNNAVGLKPYPKSRLLGYRWPTGFPVPNTPA
jgi:uncharacterized protein (TIGR02594 family)